VLEDGRGRQDVPVAGASLSETSRSSSSAAAVVSAATVFPYTFTPLTIRKHASQVIQPTAYAPTSYILLCQ